MKLVIIQFILLITVNLGLTGCGLSRSITGAEPTVETKSPQVVSDISATATTDNFDRRAMLAKIVESSILPLHRQLVTETMTLQQVTYEFRDEPTGEKLEQVQRQWQSTAAAWAQTEHLGFRFTMIVHNQIKKWPINTTFIEKFITEEADTIDEPFIESIGSTSKGLTAIEYLIFNPDLTSTAIAQRLAAEPRRIAYLVGLVENLHRKSQELLLMWVAEGDNQAQAFIEADFSANNVQGSISMLANEMIEEVEMIANTKLNYPRKGVYGDPQPQAVESPYAQYSIPLAVNNLRGLQQTFNAGFVDYVDFLQTNQSDVYLSEAINHQFEQAINALEAVSPSLQAAVIEHPDAVEQAYNEVKALLVLFKVDLANQLSITVTFSDNDGD